nr:MAG TPA: hypothetical protein [Caudoviricetes sp.]
MTADEIVVRSDFCGASGAAEMRTKQQKTLILYARARVSFRAL